MCRMRSPPSRKPTCPGGKWETCSPATVGNFSAVGYFFAREVNRQTGVPIGIIVSARGGTPVEAWMSPAALCAISERPEGLPIAELDAKFGGWENGIEANSQAIGRTRRNSSHHPWKRITAGALEPGFDDSAWKATDLFEAPPEPNKIRWLRKKITLTADQAAMPATLSLPGLNDILMVYLNGKKVTEVWNKTCVVELPPGSFQAGENQLAVRLGSCWSPPAVQQEIRMMFSSAAWTAPSISRSRMAGNFRIPWSRRCRNSSRSPTFHPASSTA